MRVNNQSIESNENSYLLQVANGGTGLGDVDRVIELFHGINKSQINQPGGILGLNREGLIPNELVPADLGGSTTVNLYGPKEVAFGQYIVIEITNYDVFTTYTILADKVSAVQSGEFIAVQGLEPSLGGSITVNGSYYPITVTAGSISFTGEAVRTARLRTVEDTTFNLTQCASATNILMGTPLKTVQQPGEGQVSWFTNAGLLPVAQTPFNYESPNVGYSASSVNGSSLTITTDHDNISVVGPVSGIFEKPVYLKMVGQGGTRVNATIYTSQIDNGGGPAGANSGTGPALMSPDYSRIPLTIGQYTVTWGELSTTTAANTYTKSYFVDYRITATGAYSHRENYTATGTYTSVPGFLATPDMVATVDNISYVWGSEKADGSGRESRNIELNYHRNQQFGEVVAGAKSANVFAVGSPRYEYAVDNDGGAVTFFYQESGQWKRNKFKRPASSPHPAFGKAIRVSADGTKSAVLSGGSGSITYFEKGAAGFEERGSSVAVANPIEIKYGTDMTATADLSSVFVLAKNSQTPIYVLRYGNNNFQLLQSVQRPTLGYDYDIGDKISHRGNFVIMQIKTKDSTPQFKLLVFKIQTDHTLLFTGKIIQDIRNWSPNFLWGSSMTFNDTGTVLFVASPGNVRAAGSIQTFVNVNDNWVYYKTMYAPDSKLADYFGDQLFYHGDNLYASARNQSGYDTVTIFR